MSAPASVVWPWAVPSSNWSVDFKNHAVSSQNIKNIINAQFDDLTADYSWMQPAQEKLLPASAKEYTSIWLNGIINPNQNHTITYKESPRTLFGHANEPVTLKNGEDVVYHGDIAPLCVGMWCHLSEPEGPFALTNRAAADLFKEDYRTKRALGANAPSGLDCFRLMRQYMEPYKAQLRRGWNGVAYLHPERPHVFLIDYLMPQFGLYTDVVKNLSNDDIWMSWWSAPNGAARQKGWGGSQFLSLMIVNDGTANEKSDALKKVAGFVPPEVLKEMWRRADHATPLRRGLFNSWFAIAKACGINEQEAITMQQETIFNALMCLSEQPNTWKKFIPQFVANPLINANLPKVVKDFCVIHLESTVAAKRCDPRQGWEMLRAANLVPQMLTWEMVVNHYQSLGPQFEREPREQIVDSILAAAHLNEHLQSLLLPDPEQEASAPVVKKRRM